MSTTTLKNNKQHVKEIIEILEKLYPNPACALIYKKPYELLFAVILSAQCTDKKVNEVTEKLFKKYTSLDDYINVEPHEFEKDIYSTGFYKAKTKSILNAAKIVKERFNEVLPKTVHEMITIPGVGRKTANVVLGELYNIAEGIAVDTHVMRLSHLLGLTRHKDDPIKIEKDLMKIIPQDDWVRFSHMLILYGREYCPARHKHIDCPLSSFYRTK